MVRVYKVVKIFTKLEGSGVFCEWITLEHQNDEALFKFNRGIGLYNRNPHAIRYFIQSHLTAGTIKNRKLIYPSATRNQDPILQVLKRFIICDVDNIEDEESPLFLEIAAGSGQHVAHFAPHFPGVKFQPTEVDDSLLGSITYYAENCPSKNILPPKLIDICQKLSFYDFEENSVDYMYNSNMIHISPFACTVGLFENAGNYLKPDALMITYGPYSKDGVIAPESNVQFDANLRARDSAWGLRDLTDLIKLAENNNLSLMDTVEMPSNNKTLIWKKN